MSSAPGAPAAPGPPASVVVVEREAVVWVGWHLEGPSDALRTVPDLVRGRPAQPDADVRYAVLLTPAWRTA